MTAYSEGLWQRAVLLAAVAGLVLIGAFGLAGCSAGGEAPPASSAVSEEVEQHDAVVIRMAVPVEAQGVLEELASSYSSEREWLDFSVAAYQTPAQMTKALAPAAEVASLPSSSSSAGEDSAEPLADVVCADSQAAMDALEETGVIDLSTRIDMLEDRLVLVAATDSPLSAVSTADLQAGSRSLVVAAAQEADGAKQREVLAALGLYADGAFVGSLAPAAAGSSSSAASSASSAAGAAVEQKVLEVKDTDGQFSLLSQNPQMVGIVRASDLYRYGGVKVVGDVPSQLYAPLRYPLALAANLDLLEDGDQVRQESEDFLRWLLSDEDAARILEKWGFRLTA